MSDPTTAGNQGKVSDVVSPSETPATDPPAQASTLGQAPATGPANQSQSATQPESGPSNISQPEIRVFSAPSTSSSSQAAEAEGAKTPCKSEYRRTGSEAEGKVKIADLT